MGEPGSCEVGGGGLLLPLFGDAEQEWPNGIRAPIYLAGLGWCFMGIAVVCDTFMGAIERITSQTVKRFDQKKNRAVTVLVWNATVANLTLMALGSSAPEILLSVVELLANDLFSGDLGPSTIVGSAAFNLLCISAVCVSAIPDGEIRTIKDMQVFAVTASFSLFAYLWLLIILLVTSPSVVEVWEGVLTFCWFPALVLLAFAADKGLLSGGGAPEPERTGTGLGPEMSKEDLGEIDASIRQEHGGDLTAEQVSQLIHAKFGEHHTWAQYRVAATRTLTAGRRVNLDQAAAAAACQHLGSPPKGHAAEFCGMKRVVPLPAEPETPEPPVLMRRAIVDFAVVRYAVKESHGSVTLAIRRTGALDFRLTVGYRTRCGSARAQVDYIPAEGRVAFAVGEVVQTISVAIVDDFVPEADEEFYVDLHDPEAEELDACVELGGDGAAVVKIIDDDLPGTLSFQEDQVRVRDPASDQILNLPVQRTGGSSGSVTCRYRSQDGTAHSSTDYDSLDGVLEFRNSETQACIPVRIKARGRYERTDYFQVTLSDPTGGANLNDGSNGGPSTCTVTVVIQPAEDVKSRIDRTMSYLRVDWAMARVGHSTWAEQFRDAVYINGGDQDAETPSAWDWVLHVITLPWKVLFASIPPSDCCGGWACFVCSLIAIGGVTAVVGDLASLLGCVLLIPDQVTAITLVALGTSLPDTFASRTAAVQDAHADASIGNITGSNSVNVFLGLGLPWMVGSAYWSIAGANDRWIARHLDDVPEAFKQGAFVVKAGDLAFTVVVFTICAFVCIGVLLLRKRLFGGELGGPRLAKQATSCCFVALWLVYVGLSSWNTMRSK